VNLQDRRFQTEHKTCFPIACIFNPTDLFVSRWLLQVIYCCCCCCCCLIFISVKIITWGQIMYRSTLNLWSIGLSWGFRLVAVFVIFELQYFIHIGVSKRSRNSLV
jgi:hypothetical protein